MTFAGKKSYLGPTSLLLQARKSNPPNPSYTLFISLHAPNVVFQGGRVPVARSGPEKKGFILKGAATKDDKLPRSRAQRVVRRFRCGDHFIIIFAVPIANPFPDIAIHIVKPQRVGLFCPTGFVLPGELPRCQAKAKAAVEPARAEYSHSASVGSRPPKDRQ